MALNEEIRLSDDGNILERGRNGLNDLSHGELKTNIVVEAGLAFAFFIFHSLSCDFLILLIDT